MAKRLERKQKVAIRQKKQAPIVRNAMRNKDCPPQELRKLLRRVPDVLAHNPNFQVVRFCLPDYPRQWIQQEEEVDPFAAYINDAFRGQNYVRWPLDVHVGLRRLLHFFLNFNLPFCFLVDRRLRAGSASGRS